MGRAAWRSFMWAWRSPPAWARSIRLRSACSATAAVSAAGALAVGAMMPGARADARRRSKRGSTAARHRWGREHSWKKGLHQRHRELLSAQGVGSAAFEGSFPFFVSVKAVHHTAVELQLKITLASRISLMKPCTCA